MNDAEPVSTEDIKDDATPSSVKESFKSFYFNESHDGIPRYCAWCDRTLKSGSNETDPKEKPIPKAQQKGGTHGICVSCTNKF